MTTTQNVTELQPRMTREQLIDAARKAAPLLPVAYRVIMTELANRSGGYATPWFAIYTAAGIGVKGE